MCACVCVNFESLVSIIFPPKRCSTSHLKDPTLLYLATDICMFPCTVRCSYKSAHRKKFYKTHTHVSILHTYGYYWSQYIKSLSDYSSGLESVGLQERVENLQDYPLVNGETSYDVSQQEMAVVLGRWVLRVFDVHI